MISVSFSAGADIFDKKKNNRFFRKDVPGIDAFCRTITVHTWSPILWKNNTRYKTDEFESCDYLALDFDDGFTLAECEQWIKGNDYLAIVGASKNHQREKVQDSGNVLPACDRYRVIIPFAETIRDPELYSVNIRAAMAERPETDKACKDTKRLFFPCREILLVHRGARRYPVVPVPEGHVTTEEKMARSVDSHARYRARKTVCGDVIAWLRYGAPRGRGNKCCFEAGRRLTLSGFSQAEILDMVAGSKLSTASDFERGVLQGIAYGEKALAGQ